jgi:prepilin-type N-terminal cleavage/methylation domain-containing protein
MRLVGETEASDEKVVAAFSLVEVMVGMMVLSVLILSLYAAIAWGFAIMRLARENIRATQVMTEKMETIRLYNWDQVNSNGFIPPTFSVPYYPIGQTNGSGLTYYGIMSINNVDFGNSYDADMKQITVTLNWTNANLPRTRTVRTLVSRYGLQNYIY